MTFSVLIIDDHKLFLAGMKHFVGTMEEKPTVTAAQSAREALEKFDRGESFSIILADIKMPDSDGFSLIAGLRARRVTTPVILLTGENNIDALNLIVEKGANGFVPKTAEPMEVLNAIREVLTNGFFLHQSENQKRVCGTDPSKYTINNQKPSPSENTRMSERQLEVLEHLATGLSNKEIAQVLNISEPTVKTHLANIFRTLGARNRTSCIEIARRIGIIS